MGPCRYGRARSTHGETANKPARFAKPQATCVLGALAYDIRYWFEGW
jgi:hypothetical protein